VAQRGDEKSSAQPSWVRTAGGTHDQLLEENWLFRLRKERFESRHTGKVHDYYVLDLADAVHVVALTPDGEVLLVRQFRAGSGRDSLEIPGGLVDPGEDPCTAGARELLEETGYAGDPPVFARHALVESLAADVSDLHGGDPKRQAGRRTESRSA